jgi:poly-gamma-glutamate capsule biosynthesis protein CapA/YwtB (metallophosphatase superfamily)
VYFLNQTLNKSLCAITRAIFRNWPEMKRLAKSQEKPFLYLIRETSVRPLRKRHLGNPADEKRKRGRRE